MNILDIISKKRDGEKLSNQEIQFWIDGVSDNSIPDYQSASLLMAILLNGMDHKETAALTLAMMNSGDIVDLSGIDGIVVDKHSTGGVGDKTSLVLTPLVACCGAKIAKMSGRGLGHTGGTLDKLESISGFNVFLSNKEFKEQINKIGCALVGQTANLVPADKALYALRDVTATVPSIPLIAASIMSKKLAASSQAILLDVKVGDGAFMKTIEDAKELANTMIGIGKELNRNVVAMISDMDQPLGRKIGNSLEVIEAIETLKNQGPRDFTELCLVACSILLTQARVVDNYDQGYQLAKKNLENGLAYQQFETWIQAQGGDINQIRNPQLLPLAKNKTVIYAKNTGYINHIYAQNLGLITMHLGGGRSKKDDLIDYGVGLDLSVTINDYVNENQPLLTIYHNNDLSDELLLECLNCFKITDQPLDDHKLIKMVLD